MRAARSSPAIPTVTNFRRMIALDTTAFFDTAVGEVVGRKVTMRARLLNEQGEALAEADGLFVVLESGFRGLKLLNQAEPLSVQILPLSQVVGV